MKKIWAFVNVALWCIAACAVDSDSWIPFLVTCITSMGIALFAWRMQGKGEANENR